MWINYIVPITIILPGICFLLKPFLSSRQYHYLTPVICGIDFILIFILYPYVFNSRIPETIIPTGLDFELKFSVDILHFFLGIISSFLWTLSSVYSIEYQRDDPAVGRYDVCSLLSLMGMLGIVFSGNLFTLYIFFELLTIASSVLIFHQQTDISLMAGLLYIFCGIIGGLILLLVIVATYNFTGTGDLYLIGVGLRNHPYFAYVFWGYIIGFGMKAGLFPFHIWLPSAHPIAPSPASALLSGVMINAGAYGILKIIYNVIGKDILINSHIFLMSCILVLALSSILFGSAVAVTQIDIKRLLAYSSIAQMGYIIMGLLFFSTSGFTGAVLHIFNHAIMKSLLFLCIGYFIRRLGLRMIPDMQGIGRKMPVTTFCFTISALSIIGLPPFCGFISKWFLVLGAFESEKLGIYHSGTGIICIIVLLISSFLNFVYYSPIIIGGWFGGEEKKTDWFNVIKEEMKGPNLWMIAPILILCFCVIFFGIFPHMPIRIVNRIVEEYFK